MDSENNFAEIEMVKWSCANCGCIACMPKSFNSQLITSHNTFYCINGHANVYSKKTDIEDIQGKLMNEYAKNAQLESKIEKLEKKLINRIFPT